MTKSNGKATLEQVIAIVNRLEDKIDKVLDDHADKIDSLESGQNKMFGGFTILAGLTFLWAWILNKFL